MYFATYFVVFQWEVDICWLFVILKKYFKTQLTRNNNNDNNDNDKLKQTSARQVK